MRKAFFSILLLLVSMPAVLRANKAQVEVNGTTTQVTFFTDEIVRVVKYPTEKGIPTSESWVVTLKPATNLNIKNQENSSKITLSSSKLTVVIDKKTGLVQFLSKGKNMLKEKSYGFQERTEDRIFKSSRRTVMR